MLEDDLSYSTEKIDKEIIMEGIPKQAVRYLPKQYIARAS